MTKNKKVIIGVIVIAVLLIILFPFYLCCKELNNDYHYPNFGPIEEHLKVNKDIILKVKRINDIPRSLNNSCSSFKLNNQMLLISCDDFHPLLYDHKIKSFTLLETDFSKFLFPAKDSIILFNKIILDIKSKKLFLMPPKIGDERERKINKLGKLFNSKYHNSHFLLHPSLGTNLWAFNCLAKKGCAGIVIDDLNNLLITKPGYFREMRSYFEALLLKNNKILVIGGIAKGKVLKSIELYDPSTGKMSTIGYLNTPVSKTKSIQFIDNKVLITGNSRAQVFNLDTGHSNEVKNGFFEVEAIPDDNWQADDYDIALLNNKYVLLSGSGSSLYDPDRNIFYPIGKSLYPFEKQKLININDKEVLIIGDWGSCELPYKWCNDFTKPICSLCGCGNKRIDYYRPAILVKYK